MYRFIIAAAAVLLMASASVNAADNRLFADCNYQKPQILCDVRLLRKEGVKTVQATLNGNAVKSVKLHDYGGKTAWLFLIDISNPRKKKTVRANVEFIKRILDQAETMNGDRNFGVATFAADMKIVSPLGSKLADVRKALQGVKAFGLSTELYRTSKEAIAHLEKFKADRKALVVFSDGQAEDKAYKRSEVVKAAKAAGVNIFALGYTEPRGDPTHLQNLRRMANETDGIYEAANQRTRKFPSAITDNFLGFLANGGQLKIDAAGLYGQQKLHIDLELTGAQTLSHDQTLTLPPKPKTGTSGADKAVDGKDKSKQEAAKTDLISWAEKNKAIAVAMLTSAILLLLLLMWGLVRALRDGGHGEPPLVLDEGDDGEPPTPSVKPVLGWLEMLDAQMSKFEITERSIRIGRGEENEFRLDNDSVSSRHAHLYITRDGEFMIDDLGSVNKTIVNGDIIEKHKLSDGDMIKLGEVGFRFVVSRQ